MKTYAQLAEIVHTMGAQVAALTKERDENQMYYEMEMEMRKALEVQVATAHAAGLREGIERAAREISRYQNNDASDYDRGWNRAVEVAVQRIKALLPREDAP